MEEWKEIEGFPGYSISNKGNVRCYRNFKGEITSEFRTLRPLLNSDDYYYVDLYTFDENRKQVHKRIHRLVAEAFVEKKDGDVVNHIDGNKHNNCSYNLEWITPEKNSTLASQTGLYKTKSIRIIETGEIFSSIKKCAETIKCDPADINHCLSGVISNVHGLTFEYANTSDFLRDYQIDAVSRMKDGCILNGGVGSGKSRTGLYYYFKEYGGNKITGYSPMNNPPDLYIITTARKRDTYEWEKELSYYTMSSDPNVNYYKNKIVVDSWNNIGKYIDVKDAFFIFDEQRVVGKGAWVKAFLKITKINRWILLSATAGDTWEDYVPVFIANGYFKNRTEFNREHAVFSRFTKYPKIERYLNTGRLVRLRNNLLIDMDFNRQTISHHEDIWCSYNVFLYKDLIKNRWNPWEEKPIETASELCYAMRRICNSDVSRLISLMELFEKHPKMIVFYNFDYELDILKTAGWPPGVVIAEWNGHAHQPVPDSETWIYLVQYTAGCEGWNCITTDTIVFWSQNYSYKVMEQARGRIDRMNTPFIDLYYYHLKSRSGIDLAIAKAISNKKKFNEGKFIDHGR